MLLRNLKYFKLKKIYILNDFAIFLNKNILSYIIVRILYPFIKSLVNPWLILLLILLHFFESSFNSSWTSTFFDLFELILLSKLNKLLIIFAVLTKLAISVLFVKLSCFNLAVKLSTVDLLNSLVVIYLARSWSFILFSMSLFLVLLSTKLFDLSNCFWKALVIVIPFFMF